jgi:pimeloyl-ACP methyl ester carboxylesterase
MEFRDDDLKIFEEYGPTPLPEGATAGYIENEGAKIWYASYGNGSPVILLHGGLGNSGNWGYQVEALKNSHRVVVIDSRGHGRSTRDARPYTYEVMGSDVLKVMDQLEINHAPMIGWSDGACIAIVLAKSHPERVKSVFFFGCNMDPSGTKDFNPSPVIGRCFSRHEKDYAALSSTPGDFKDFVDAVSQMQKIEPNYSAVDLASIRVPVTIVQSEFDEFIKNEHAHYLAKSIPGAKFLSLKSVSHFAPLQRPSEFNATIKLFLSA